MDFAPSPAVETAAATAAEPDAVDLDPADAGAADADAAERDLADPVDFAGAGRDPAELADLAETATDHADPAETDQTELADSAEPVEPAEPGAPSAPAGGDTAVGTGWRAGSHRSAGTRPAGPFRVAGRDRRAVVGVVLAGAVVLLALAGPYLAPHPAGAVVGRPFLASGATSVLGTDALGRDVLSRFLAGGRGLLLASLLAAALAVAAGAVLALVTGYGRVRVRRFLAPAGGLVRAVPPVVLAVVLLARFGPHPWIAVAALAVALVPRTAAALRADVRAVAARGHVRAAEASGLRPWAVRRRELLPNLAAPLVAALGRTAGTALGLLTGLGLFGLGPAGSWGRLLGENLPVAALRPVPLLLPAVAVGVLAVGLALAADGVARAYTRTSEESVAPATDSSDAGELEVET